MNAIQSIPPTVIPNKRNACDYPKSTLSAIVKLNHGNFTFECLNRKWDKRYRFEHPDLGLVIFDENGEKMIFTTVDYSRKELNEFKRFVIAWQFQEKK